MLEEKEIGIIETPLEEMTRTYRSVMKDCSWSQTILLNNIIQETKRALIRFHKLIQGGQ